MDELLHPQLRFYAFTLSVFFGHLNKTSLLSLKHPVKAYIYTTSSNDWTEVAPMTQGRSGHSCGLVDDRVNNVKTVVVVGGQTEDGALTDEVEIYRAVCLLIDNFLPPPSKQKEHIHYSLLVGDINSPFLNSCFWYTDFFGYQLTYKNIQRSVRLE